jgi:hypothetical protein
MMALRMLAAGGEPWDAARDHRHSFRCLGSGYPADAATS